MRSAADRVAAVVRAEVLAVCKTTAMRQYQAGVDRGLITAFVGKRVKIEATGPDLPDLQGARRYGVSTTFPGLAHSQALARAPDVSSSGMHCAMAGQSFSGVVRGKQVG